MTRDCSGRDMSEVWSEMYVDASIKILAHCLWTKSWTALPICCQWDVHLPRCQPATDLSFSLTTRIERKKGTTKSTNAWVCHAQLNNNTLHHLITRFGCQLHSWTLCKWYFLLEMIIQTWNRAIKMLCDEVSDRNRKSLAIPVGYQIRTHLFLTKTNSLNLFSVGL